MTHEEEIQSLNNRIEDLNTKLENYEEENGQLRAKNSELWTELVGLRREAEQGFEYYPGPSSNCVMCDVDITSTEGEPNEPKEKIKLRIAHGLCDECKPQYDQLHPESRVNPQAGVEEEKPKLRTV